MTLEAEREIVDSTAAVRGVNHAAGSLSLVRGFHHRETALNAVQMTRGIDAVQAQMAVTAGDQPGSNLHVVPGRPAREDVIIVNASFVAAAAAPVVLIPLRQQQHAVAGGVLDAVTSALDGETEAAGVGKLGVFRLGIDVVVQLKLAGGEHADVSRGFAVHQDLPGMGKRPSRRQRR